jgi:hypothetical protein
MIKIIISDNTLSIAHTESMFYENIAILLDNIALYFCCLTIAILYFEAGFKTTITGRNGGNDEMLISPPTSQLFCMDEILLIEKKAGSRWPC